MSNFVVSARKYRPQRFEDVVGQQHVAGTLKNALATDHVAHAFLFTGPRGVGKTTCARILAKILNCEQRTAQYEACEQCSSCTSFNDNASFNIIELDAASNNSVEHIRALTEQVRFPPQHGRYKVFIIDEVHMLSNQAFNAFLKTLEEPPSYAIFILATTEKHKIIPTILSRCQIFDFRRITAGDMVLHLQGICEKEGITADADALHIIAQKADGALRDSLSIFDRITSFSGKNISYADVIENLNVLDYDYYFSITEALMTEDLSGLLNIFDQILRKGFEPDIFVSGLAEHLRNILVCKDATTLALLETGDSLRERYRKQAALAPASFLLSALNLCNDCDINFKMARHKRLHVEMALIKMCHINSAISAAQEKKTTDLTKPVVKLTGSTMVSEPNPTGLVKPPTGNAHTLSADALQELNAGLNQKTLKAETIPLNLRAYDEAVALEEARKSKLESRFSLENVKSVWGKYAQSHESNLVRLALQNATIRVEDKSILVTVGGTIDRNHIQGETMRLLDMLRHELHDMAVKIQIEIDESKSQDSAPQKMARPLTHREKLDLARQANPAIDELITCFDLKIDS